jgi:hypothetical protein
LRAWRLPHWEKSSRLAKAFGVANVRDPFDYASGRAHVPPDHTPPELDGFRLRQGYGRDKLSRRVWKSYRSDHEGRTRF